MSVLNMKDWNVRCKFSPYIYEQDKFKLTSNTSHIYLEDKCPDKMNTLNKQLMLRNVTQTNKILLKTNVLEN